MSDAPLFLVGGTNLFRRGLISFLQATDYAVTAEFDTVRDCIDAASNHDDPEIIVYVSNGDIYASHDAVGELIAACADTRVMVLSAELSVEELGACLKAGARGYLLSSISTEALGHSLTLVALGETVFPSGLATAWTTGGVSHRRGVDRSTVQDLTRRETDILDCLTEGSSNKEIARNLGITEATVKIHMKSLIRKIGVRNRTQAALWAISSGFGQSTMHVAA